MGALSIRFRAEPVRSLAFGSIAAGYTGVGTAVDHPIRQFIVQNLTDETVMFSFDGVDDHFPLPAGGLFIDDISSNQSHSAQGWFLAQDTRLYVKQLGVPTTGAVYFSVFYGAD
jgi:hypothetical protein